MIRPRGRGEVVEDLGPAATGRQRLRHCGAAYGLCQRITPLQATRPHQQLDWCGVPKEHPYVAVIRRTPLPLPDSAVPSAASTLLVATGVVASAASPCARRYTHSDSPSTRRAEPARTLDRLGRSVKPGPHRPGTVEVRPRNARSRISFATPNSALPLCDLARFTRALRRWAPL